MQENILLFLLYSIIVIGVMYNAPIKGKKYGLLIFNVLFYLLCDLKFFLLMFAGIVWSFLVGILLSQRKNKWLLLSGITPIVGILCFFKYYHFFLPQVKDILHITIPLGISYYTFKIISYMVELYRGNLKGEIAFIDYANYISFFPQIICGPISRPEELLGQISDLKRKQNSQDMEEGIFLIVSGLFKKLVIADRVNAYVNTIFEGYVAYPALALWIAAFLYTIQIYCDFSGYSEIAIGICRLLGIECKSNFKLPYFSCSIREFWSKWHISLSSWLKDYVYIPLGGNKKGKYRRNFNVLSTFFVSGMWHGNTLPFIVWGLYHGIFNILSKEKSKNRWVAVCQTFFTFGVIMYGWIIFKCKTLKDVVTYTMHMFEEFSLDRNVLIESIIPFTGDYSCLAYLITICVFVTILFAFEYKEFTRETGLSKQEKSVMQVISISSIILFGVMGQNSFLYANF